MAMVICTECGKECSVVDESFDYTFGSQQGYEEVYVSDCCGARISEEDAE